MSINPKFTGITVIREGWKFKRVSAAYIDVSPPGSSMAVDCINVYDYAAGKPTLELDDRKGQKRLAADWLRDNRDDLHHYMEMAR